MAMKHTLLLLPALAACGSPPVDGPDIARRVYHDCVLRAVLSASHDESACTTGLADNSDLVALFPACGGMKDRAVREACIESRAGIPAVTPRDVSAAMARLRERDNQAKQGLASASPAPPGGSTDTREVRNRRL